MICEEARGVENEEVLTSPKRSAALECDEGTRNILEKLKSKII
jgi:hypothetical protein